MQGIGISRKYYEMCGREMINSQFSLYENKIAVGIAGPGSDCFGFDDETSRDHDFGAGFCLWVDDETYSRIGFDLTRAYCELPDEIDGIRKYKIRPYGTDRFGVIKISDFYLPLTGSKGAPESELQWLQIPDYALAAAVNGEVFRDDLGKFTEIRNKIAKMPEDIRLKKISARAIAMAQSGQYNFKRCLLHGEKGAAATAMSEFVNEAVKLCYTIDGKYAPFYKWAFRGMSRLETFGYLRDDLENLITSATDMNQFDEVERICSIFADYFRKQGLSGSHDIFLEPHAYSIREKIGSPVIRNMHIMEG